VLLRGGCGRAAERRDKQRRRQGAVPERKTDRRIHVWRFA
jgi:hypothetical protein